MPHLKCAACKGRVSSSQSPEDTAGGPCPRCGSPLQRVMLLAEIVGFQAISRGPSSSPGAGAGYSGLAARIDHVRGRRDESQPQPPFESSRWLDDGDGLPAEPLARAIALRDPRSRV
jgi:DNA-directed RNA polymerase subunit RPC12/RpoP